MVWVFCSLAIIKDCKILEEHVKKEASALNGGSMGWGRGGERMLLWSRRVKAQQLNTCVT